MTRGRAATRAAAAACASSRSATSALLLLAPLVMIFYKTFEHGIGPPLDAITSPDGAARAQADPADGRDRGAR